MKKLRRLAFEHVADELEDPSDDEQRQGVQPEMVIVEAGDEYSERDEYGRDAECVAGAIDGMLMAGRVLRNPVIGGAVAEHRWDDTTSFGGAKAPSLWGLNATLKAALPR